MSAMEVDGEAEGAAAPSEAPISLGVPDASAVENHAEDEDDGHHSGGRVKGSTLAKASYEAMRDKVVMALMREELGSGTVSNPTRFKQWREVVIVATTIGLTEGANTSGKNLRLRAGKRYHEALDHAIQVASGSAGASKKPVLPILEGISARNLQYFKHSTFRAAQMNDPSHLVTGDNIWKTLFPSVKRQIKNQITEALDACTKGGARRTGIASGKNIEDLLLAVRARLLVSAATKWSKNGWGTKPEGVSRSLGTDLKKEDFEALVSDGPPKPPLLATAEKRAKELGYTPPSWLAFLAFGGADTMLKTLSGRGITRVQQQEDALASSRGETGSRDDVTFVERVDGLRCEMRLVTMQGAATESRQSAALLHDATVAAVKNLDKSIVDLRAQISEAKEDKEDDWEEVCRALKVKLKAARAKRHAASEAEGIASERMQAQARRPPPTMADAQGLLEAERTKTARDSTGATNGDRPRKRSKSLPAALSLDVAIDPEADASRGNGYASSGSSGLSQENSLVLSAFKNDEGDPKGRSVCDVIRECNAHGLTEVQVLQAIESLAGDGVLYSTVDESHFRTTYSNKA